MTVVAAKVTPRGVLVPRALIATWGDLREVEIEKYADTVVIRPRPSEAASWRDQMIDRMKIAGLIEDLLWPAPPAVSPEARAPRRETEPRQAPLGTHYGGPGGVRVSIYYLDASALVKRYVHVPARVAQPA